MNALNYFMLLIALLLTGCAASKSTTMNTQNYANDYFSLMTPHVVHFDATGKVAYARESLGYHIGMEEIHTFGSFYEADAYCKALDGRVPSVNLTYLVWHRHGVIINGKKVHQTSETLKCPTDLKVSELKYLFTEVLNAKYKPGSYRLQYYIGKWSE